MAGGEHYFHRCYLIRNARTNAIKNRWLFIVEGVVTIAWALVSVFLLLDFPQNTASLSERERYIAINRLRESNVATNDGTGEKIGKRKSFILALADWRTWGFILGYMVRQSSGLYKPSFEKQLEANRLSRSLSVPRRCPTSTQHLFTVLASPV